MNLGFLGRKGPEGEKLGPVSEGIAALGVQLSGDFVKGGAQGGGKGSAAVLVDGFVRDNEGEKLCLGNLDAGEISRAGEVKSVAACIVLDWEVHSVSHEFDIAPRGFFGNLEFGGDARAVGVGADFEEAEDLVHAGKWGALAGEEASGGGDSRFSGRGCQDVSCRSFGQREFATDGKFLFLSFDF